jgi:hypothetical protein
MRRVLVAFCVCSPLLLGGCVVAVAGVGAGAGYLAGENKSADRTYPDQPSDQPSPQTDSSAVPRQ